MMQSQGAQERPQTTDFSMTKKSPNVRFMIHGKQQQQKTTSELPPQSPIPKPPSPSTASVEMVNIGDRAHNLDLAAAAAEKLANAIEGAVDIIDKL